MNDTDRELLLEQIEYYKVRAPEYDEWFFRKGRYDRGAEVNASWFSDVLEVRQVVEAWNPGGEILEFAAGTGLWTQVLAPGAERVTAVDSSAEALRLCRERVGDAGQVETVVADIFSYAPGRRFDAVFFGFWLSHVPPERFDEFWRLVDSVLEPDGSVFFVDSRQTDRSTARDHESPGSDGVVTRKLNDGREFRVVKVFYDPSELVKRLAGLGWSFEARASREFFIYGGGERAS